MSDIPIPGLAFLNPFLYICLSFKILSPLKNLFEVDLEFQFDNDFLLDHELLHLNFT